MKTVIVLVLSGLVSACSLVGDGRGFASVQGSVEVELEDDSFTSNTDATIEIEKFDVRVTFIQLEATVTDESGTETLKTIMPVSSAIDATEKNSAVAFGPFEVGKAYYSELGARIDRVKLNWTQDDGDEFGLVLNDLDLTVKAAADLPVDRDELPQINLVCVLTVPESVLDNVTSGMSEAEAKAQITANLEAGLELSATWTRQAD